MKDVTRKGLVLSSSLAFVAGYVDAIGFIATGGMFVSFMSGNSTQIGVELFQDGLAQALMGAALVGGFLVGVVLAAMFASRGGDHRRDVVGTAALAMAIVAASEILGWPSPWWYVLVAAAMGSLNTLYLADGRARVAITYATGTLVSLGLALAALVTGRSRTAWIRPLLLWGSLAVGAVVGAGIHFVSPAWSLAFGAAALFAIASALAVRRPLQRAGARAPR
ncbi:YoaK family protein [Gulosibacter faecalis]|jgi:uncharacterized membrane protein YoaK (UPF0700 family)|uniref:YoaK family protein n=1 Tax=Gulosibacter faecalis TaxID=272240 RepID=A0ABW5UVX6_9MICO|nr:YoaK family protein [Gulosibacter faecalis]